jgi:hypothetical protein
LYSYKTRHYSYSSPTSRFHHYDNSFLTSTTKYVGYVGDTILEIGEYCVERSYQAYDWVSIKMRRSQGYSPVTGFTEYETPALDWEDE